MDHGRRNHGRMSGNLLSSFFVEHLPEATIQTP